MDRHKEIEYGIGDTFMLFWDWELSYWENLYNSSKTMTLFAILICVLLLISFASEKWTRKIKTREEKQELENARALGILMLMLIVASLAISVPFIKKNLHAEAVSATEEKRETNRTMQYKSETTKDDCHFCGDNIGRIHSYYFREKNIAIIDLNSFNFHVIEINRYNSDGNLLERDASHSTLSMSSLQSGEKIWFDIIGSRGFADGHVTLTDDSILSLDKLKSYLCSDCLTELMNQYVYDEEHWNIAILNLEERTIKALDKNRTRFQSGDFTIWSSYDNENKKVNLIILYCPVN